jgi:TatD DNase family protein
MLPLLKSWTEADKRPDTSSRGVIHCFSGDTETARRYLEMGFYIAFGAYTGYPSSALSRDAVRSIPADRLLIETDSPFLPPQSHRGKRNEPAYVQITLRTLGEMRDVLLETIARETTENARRLFRRPEG